MKDKYLLFGFNGYYPMGGLNDFLTSSCDLNELCDCIINNHFSKNFAYQIYDVTNHTAVKINMTEETGRSKTKQGIIEQINSLEFKTLNKEMLI